MELRYFEHVLEKLQAILHTVQGWVADAIGCGVAIVFSFFM